MSKFYHITREGKKILLQDLDDDHLNNIINWIERMSKEGLQVIYGGPMMDPEDFCMDYLYGDIVKRRMKYDYYVKEKERRSKQ